MTEIVHRISPAKQKTKQKTWQKSLVNLITCPEKLFAHLQLDPAYLAEAKKATALFPLRVTKHFLGQIEKGNINDPLLKQILPIGLEFEKKSGFSNDPLDESKFNPIPGLLHKYQSRVLLTVTQACAIHCRYCFRREFNYADNNKGQQSWPAILDYIQQHPEVNEVIYSGGDPLTANDAYLATLTEQLAKLPQLIRLRIHTRLPLLIPERIDAEFVQWFCGHPELQPVLVLHCNHANEISSKVQRALQRLQQAGVTLLNQTVLLKGINDTAETLSALSEALFSVAVLPYYLHLLDRINGAAHFEVSEAKAKNIMAQLKAQLPGFLVPKLVREQAGEISKTDI